MPLVLDRSAPQGTSALAGLVQELLSDPRRPDPDRLPVPAAGSVAPLMEAAGAAAPAPQAPRGPSIPAGPTGLGTAVARILLASEPNAAPVEGSPAAPASAWTAPRPSGLGTSASRLAGAAATTDEPPAVEDDAMPELFCPGPLRDDPELGELLNEAVVDWAGEVGIYPGRLDRLRAANFGRFIMLSHPGTRDPDRLLAATKCLVAEWAADDYYVDEAELGADPDVQSARLLKLYAVIDPADLPGRYQWQLDEYRRDEPILVAFRSALRHLARYASTTQIARFQHQMGFMFVAWDLEAEWRRTKRAPSVWEYLVQRHYDSYLPPMILMDALAGYELPPNEYYDRRVRRAFKIAGAANVLLNDIHSEAFESEHDYSLPRVIATEEGCSPREAIRRTVLIHNELMSTFVDEAAALSAVGSPMLRRFFLDTWAWLGGSREWHATTRKYQKDAAAGAGASDAASASGPHAV